MVVVKYEVKIDIKMTISGGKDHDHADHPGAGGRRGGAAQPVHGEAAPCRDPHGYNHLHHQVVLSHLNKARILAKRKAGRKLCHSDSEEAVTHVRVLATSLAQYQVSLIHSAPRISFH